MFDEYNEGNQIAKIAETSAWVPSGSGIRALDEDGTACSADYYLRLTNDGGYGGASGVALAKGNYTRRGPGPRTRRTSSRSRRTRTTS